MFSAGNVNRTRENFLIMIRLKISVLFIIINPNSKFQGNALFGLSYISFAACIISETVKLLLIGKLFILQTFPN